jgi:hypothetical protein
LLQFVVRPLHHGEGRDDPTTMEQMLQMMERMLSNLEEIKANQEMHLEMRDAKEEASHKGTKRRWRPHWKDCDPGKATTARQIVTEACPEHLKAAVDVFEESPDKIKAIQVNPGATEAAVEQ